MDYYIFSISIIKVRGTFVNFTSNNNLFNYQAKVLRELAEMSSYVVIGRAADYVLNDKPNLVRVFIYASREKCIQKEMNRQK
mgnify:CR=1 FL=1